MTYAVKELYATLQGEGAQTGRAAVFVRFAGCNLWTGREADRPSAICRFCDTDFVGVDGPGGGRFETAAALAQAARAAWDAAAIVGGGRPYLVCTGGEPLLQLDPALADAFHDRGFEVAVETNGTLAPEAVVARLDWICVSPKGAAPLALTHGHELKLVFPQPEREADPSGFEHLAFEHFFLQPMDTPDPQLNKMHIAAAAAACRARPQWRLSLQTHKLIGLP